MSTIKRVFLYLLCAFMTVAGVNHFVNPAVYVALIPPFFPAPEFLNYASGAAEIVCGLGLLWPRYRRLAAWGVIAVLIAVYPANIYHAVSGGLSHPDLPESFANPTLAWARLPVQLVFLAWAWWFTRPDGDSGTAAGDG